MATDGNGYWFRIAVHVLRTIGHFVLWHKTSALDVMVNVFYTLEGQWQVTYKHNSGNSNVITQINFGLRV
jgi:hypothetical protein